MPCRKTNLSNYISIIQMLDKANELRPISKYSENELEYLFRSLQESLKILFSPFFSASFQKGGLEFKEKIEFTWW